MKNFQMFFSDYVLTVSDTAYAQNFFFLAKRKNRNCPSLKVRVPGEADL
jgi:uncharacterized protein YcsI (UPF0317 family)